MSENMCYFGPNEAECLTFSKNNTGCQWQPIIFPLISNSCAPYRYQDHLRIQNMKFSSWALTFQSPKPKTDPGSSTILSQTY